ncbi:hypothetical protein ACP70R_022271 [Stipagrostis hirtigluma subsp. patula]
MRQPAATTPAGQVGACFAGVVAGSLLFAGGMVLAFDRVFGGREIGVPDVIAAVLLSVGGFIVAWLGSTGPAPTTARRTPAPRVL